MTRFISIIVSSPDISSLRFPSPMSWYSFWWNHQLILSTERKSIFEWDLTKAFFCKERNQIDLVLFAGSIIISALAALYISVTRADVHVYLFSAMSQNLSVIWHAACLSQHRDTENGSVRRPDDDFVRSLLSGIKSWDEVRGWPQQSE